jgi:hypothetical protein
MIRKKARLVCASLARDRVFWVSLDLVVHSAAATNATTYSPASSTSILHYSFPFKRLSFTLILHSAFFIPHLGIEAFGGQQ